MGQPEFTVTELDVQRLSPILKVHEAGYAAAVVRYLRTKFRDSPAIPAEKVPPDLVTMNCRVQYQDERTGIKSELVISYPQTEDPARGLVSILEPVCATLLGSRIGKSVEFTLGPGEPTRLKVLDLAYQPERAGHYHL